MFHVPVEFNTHVGTQKQHMTFISDACTVENQELLMTLGGKLGFLCTRLVFVVMSKYECSIDYNYRHTSTSRLNSGDMVCRKQKGL